jgi:glycosyltransferase involved in cell wall biosynthesis
MGKRYTPADGVEDYCACLGQALARRGVKLEQARVSWNDDGWKAALQKLERQATDWRGQWVFFQYTALGWSSRGFPFGAQRVLSVLARSGARVGVVFHEFGRQDSGHFLVQPIRGACQELVIRRLYARSDLSIFTIPTQRMAWLPAHQSKAAFIPIGANIPEPAASAYAANGREPAQKTVAVFSFTPGPRQEVEIGEIVHAVGKAQAAGLKMHLVVFGSGSDEVRGKMEMAFAGSGVRLSVLGMLAPEEITNALSRADVQLFVRGPVAQTRGTALAGIACGLPIVGYAGSAEGTSIAEGGLQLVPYRDKEALAAALLRVLDDPELRENLRRRSWQAQQKYFSWDAIAAKYAAACRLDSTVPLPLNSALDSPRAIAGDLLK